MSATTIGSPSWPKGGSNGSRSRWPIFELPLLLVIVGLAWSALRVQDLLNDWEASAATPPSEARQGGREIQEVLKLQSLIEIRDRFANLAERLEPGVLELRAALQGFTRDKNRTDIGRYLRSSQALSSWLRHEQQAVDPRKLRELQSWLETTATSASTAPATNSIDLDLDRLLKDAQQAYSRYLADIGLAEGQSLTPDLVQDKISKSRNAEQSLLQLAATARKRAGALTSFVDQRPTELAQEAHRRGRDERQSAFLVQFREVLRPVYYLLVLGVIILTALLLVALYGRYVVAPLRQKLIEDNAAIDQQKKLDQFARLATGLAHEIRNPLTAISVRLFTLQKTIDKRTNEHNDAALIRNEIDRLEQILKNFLKLARPTEPKFAVLTAEPALREVRDLLGPQLQRQAIELKLDSMASTRFHADPLQLKQVLINLVQNAADAIGRRGAITLRARQDEVRLNGQPVESVVLEVEDTGAGISPEVQERLFDPFFSTKENGTGLGLPIAAKIIDQHRGILDFETRPGHGTTFRVILPMSTH